MPRLCAVGTVALAALFSERAFADADGGVALAPIVVPLPPAVAAPESFARREPTGSITEVDVGHHSGEAKDAAQLLSTAPGVLIQDLGGLGQLKTLSLRGASPNGVLFFLDGVPLNGAGGELDLASIPSAIVDRFEVLRGGAGAKYGSGGLGGAVNIVTKQAKDGAHLAGEASFGSFGTQTAQVAGTGALWGGAGLALVHVAQSTGDFPYRYNPTPQLLDAPGVLSVRRNNDASLAGALLKWGRPVGANGTLDAMLEVSGLDRGLAGTVQAPTPDAREADTRFSATAHAARGLDHGELDARAWVRRNELGLWGGPFQGGIRQTELVAGGEAQASYLWGVHGFNATLQAGHEALDVVGGAGPTREVLSAMVSDEILLRGGQLSVVPSFRVDRAGAFNGVSPKLGASVLLPAGFSARANVGQAFRAPSFLELYVAQGTLAPNPTLQPERALYGDTQLSREGRLSKVALGGFYALYENLISYEYYPPLFAKPYNFYAARVSGLEAEGELHPRPWFSASAAYTLTFSQNLRDDPRYYLKDLPYRPRHRLSARASGGPALARARCELIYQAEQFVNRTQTLALPARAFVNAGLSSELFRAPSIVAAVELKNVLDTQAQDFDGYPLPGRAIYVTLSISWDRVPDAQAAAPSDSPLMLTSR